MRSMPHWIDPDLLELVRLHLRKHRSFVVRRCVLWYTEGEMTAREAVAQIRQLPDLPDDD